MPWTRERFTILTKQHQRPTDVVPTEVDGLVHVSGLALHSRGEYTDVTHVASGHRVASFTSIGPAFEFIERVAMMIDWRATTPLITDTFRDLLINTADLLERATPRATVHL